MKKQHVFWFLLFLALSVGLYGVFILDLGGQSFASHMQDLWRSKLVQEKVAYINKHFDHKVNVLTQKLNGERKQPESQKYVEPHPTELHTTPPVAVKSKKTDSREIDSADKKGLDNILDGAY